MDCPPLGSQEEPSQHREPALQPRVGGGDECLLNIFTNQLLFSADKSISTNKGELPAQLTSEGVIKVLLSANLNKLSSTPKTVKKEDKESLPITPNYIRSPPLGYKVDTNNREQAAVQEKRPRVESARQTPQR